MITPPWPDVFSTAPRGYARALAKDLVSAIAAGGEAVIALPGHPYAREEAVTLIRVWTRTLFRDAIVTKQEQTITVRRAVEGERS